MFGRNLDAHTPSTGNGHGNELRGLVSRDLPTGRQCLVGRECYVSTLRVTLMACVVALALSAWAGVRKRQNHVKKGLIGSLE